ncbi:MAG: alpha-amylase [Alphaproteobacteria bacterium]|nr:alpha-amylase [Alphaproteobacteria bacterium]MDE2629381.1 alpha-amylase [Alphaproteobacteria bacterium]
MLCAAPGIGAPQGTAAAQNYRQRLPQDEIVYFLLPDRFENGDRSNDRGGLKGGRLTTGYDPASKGFYHGGDLKGVIKRLDYIQSLGATAVWLAPVFKNKPVQGPKGGESAGYHGYWITDFTRVDPHFGTDADFKALVDAVHARGMKFYMDIVVNHTADVIQYRECTITNIVNEHSCAYRSRADYPYTREGGVDGKPINPGFLGDEPQYQTPENFTKLTNPDYAYHVYIPKGEEHEKVPDWLNNPIYYHNRGNSTFENESSTMGDFGGLDDLYTENPRVVQGMIDIYGAWIDKYGVDGFRIDTEQHVNPKFWQKFVPAILARAKADGIPNFHIFGEVGMDDPDVAKNARHTREDKMPYCLDYPFAEAVRQVVAGTRGPDVLARLFADDVLYEGGYHTAEGLPTFVSNHDQGRFAYFVRTAFPKASDDEVLKRVILAHAMMFTLRGVPVVYYGDEQGFAGLGGDQDARQDMFPSKVVSYNTDPLVGTKATTAESNFNRSHPIYRAIAELARLRTTHEALRRGVQIVRNYSDKPGLFAVSRIDPETGREILVAFNTSASPLTAQVEINPASQHFAALHGVCAATPKVPGSYQVVLAPLDYVVCAEGAGG